MPRNLRFSRKLENISRVGLRRGYRQLGMAELAEYAGRAEVEQALLGLSEADLLRLHRFANWKARSLRGSSKGRDGDDLLQEAVMSTLVGAEGTEDGRKWNKKIPFRQHLEGAIRSTASHWRREAQLEPETLETDLSRVTDEGEETNEAALAPDSEPGPERIAEARENLAQVMSYFAEDDNAVLVLEGLREGLKRSEMLELGITSADYDAALKRIRYRLTR
jgi:hypothetical protein